MHRSSSDGHELLHVQVLRRNAQAFEAGGRGAEHRRRPAQEDVGSAQVRGKVTPEESGVDEAGLSLPAGGWIGQYVDDLANAWIAIAELRVLTMTTIPSLP